MLAAAAVDEGIRAITRKRQLADRKSERRAINPPSCIAFFRGLQKLERTGREARALIRRRRLMGSNMYLRDPFRLEPGFNEDHPLCLYSAKLVSSRFFLSSVWIRL